MRIGNVAGRAVLILEDGIVDVATASDGRFGPGLGAVYDEWASFASWAENVATPTGPLEMDQLQNPAPEPRQVFAIGLNYRDHAEEAGLSVPDTPATFTKFPASLSGPFDDVEVLAPRVDWEAELVAVIGRRADRIAPQDGWDFVAGLAVGQDISDRDLQFAAGSQFSLGKSRRGYGPIGPWLVTPGELPDADDLAITCSINGEVVQDSRTSEMVFGVARLVAELSAIVPLLAGDIIFTGTPAGVGFTRHPPRSLRPGMVVETSIEGIGTMRNRCV